MDQFLQPTVAILFGIRDGLLDDKSGTTPLIRSVVFHGDRRRRLKGVLLRLVVPMTVATVADAIVQYVMIEHVRPLIALIVGMSLMALPYSIARRFSNRIMSRRRSWPLRAASHDESGGSA